MWFSTGREITGQVSRWGVAIIRCGSRTIKFKKDALLNFVSMCYPQGRNLREEGYLNSDISTEFSQESSWAR